MITHWIKPLFYLVGISAINVPRITHPENRPASDRNEILQFSFISTEYTNSKHDLISTCEIVYKYPKNAPSNTFHCKTENGLELDLFAGEKLDREEIAHYKLDFKGYNADKELIAESKNSLTVEVLDENDNSPEFIVESLQGKVKESAAIGTPVLTVKATDKDDPRTECWSESKSPSACIRFSETLNCKMKTVKNSQFFKNCDQSYFKIDKHGVISTKQRIDAEAVLEFSLEIKAMDGRESALSHEVSEKVFISVEDSNDHRPEFRKKMYRFKVKENIGVNDPIGNVYASDEDRDVIHNKVVYMVDDNFSDNFEFKDGNKLFLKTGFKLDFENLKKFPKHRKEIKIRAQNEKLPKTHMFDEATVVIDILDVNEPPELVGAGLVLQTKENGKTASYSKTSGIVTVRDIDFLGNQTVKFGIEDPEGWFRLSEEKTLAQKVTNSDFKHYQVKISLKTGIKVDRECANCENGEYVFHVLASDNYNPAAVGRIQVQLIIEDVNDNAPEFETPVHRICSRNQGFTEPMSVIPGLENVEIVDQDSKVNGKPFFVEYLPGKSSSGLKSLISFENMGESLKFSSIEQDLPLGRFDLVFRMKDGKSLSALRRLTVETCSCTMRGICPKAVLVVAGGEGDKDWTIWLWTILGMVLLLIAVLAFLVWRQRGPRKEPEFEDDKLHHTFRPDHETYQTQQYQDQQPLVENAYQHKARTVTNPTQPSNYIVQQLQNTDPSNYEQFIRQLKDEVDDNLFGECSGGAADELYCAPMNEGNNSDAGSLSSLNYSSSDESVNYTPERTWGPKFAKLADICQGDEE